MSIYYPKINGVYKRHADGPDKGKFIMGEYSLPEYEQLLNVPWYWTYKWDGTCSGIYFREDSYPYAFGKSKKSQLTKEMADALANWSIGPGSQFRKSGLTIYGELVGPKIQSNPHGLEHVTFQPFDVRYQDHFWPKHRVFEEIPGAQYYVTQTLGDAIQQFAGRLGAPPPGKRYEEGFVGTPDLCELKGNRITTKLKWKDFQ